MSQAEQKHIKNDTAVYRYYMKEAVKNCSLFIGTVIGAGFASGREVALFFKGNSPFIALFSGLVLGACCILFMLLGKGVKDLDSKLFGRFATPFKVLSGICSFIIFIAMFAGSEYIICEMFGMRYFGVISAVAVIAISVCGIEKIKILNVVVVPFILMLVAVIFFKCACFSSSGTVSLATPLGYAAMNMLVGGYVMAEAGKTSTSKQAVWSGILSGVILAVMLYMIQCVVSSRIDLAMPLYSAAVESGLKTVGGLLIYLAIFTTFASSVNILYNDLNKYIKSTPVTCFAMLIAGWLVTAFITFEQAVNYGYPFVSAMGVLLTVSALFVFLKTKKAPLFLSGAVNNKN